VGELLSDLGVLGGDDVKLLRSMSGMRNILVHAYATVRRNLITDSSRNLRDDAPRHAKTMRGSLEGKTVDPPSSADLAERLSNVFRGRVKAALLFGGRAKGYSMKGDYDVAVYFGRTHNLYELGELAVEIAEALNLREDQLDVLSLDSASPEMVLEALNGEPIYVDDDHILFTLRLKALTEWLDLRSGMQSILGVHL
jgi:predicted nucleotidyltransferase